MPRNVIHQEQGNQSAQATGQKNETEEKQGQDNVIVPGRTILHLNPIGDQDGTAQEHERPAAECHRPQKFVREDLVGPHRRTEEKRCLRRREQAAVQDDAGGKNQEHGQGDEKHVEDPHHDAHIERHAPAARALQLLKAEVTNDKQTSPDEQAAQQNGGDADQGSSQQHAQVVAQQPPAQPLKEQELVDFHDIVHVRLPSALSKTEALARNFLASASGSLYNSRADISGTLQRCLFGQFQKYFFEGAVHGGLFTEGVETAAAD